MKMRAYQVLIFGASFLFWQKSDALPQVPKDFDERRTLNYSVIESTGKFCPGRDSCRQTRNARGPDGVENDWKKRNCFCDNNCAIYGDCCVDAPAFRKAEQVINIISDSLTFG